MSINEQIPEILYHYTNYESFNCILKYGTLRFKESTRSNDALDTVRLIHILRDLDYTKIIKNTEMKVQYDFLLRYFEKEIYQRTNIALVTCFTQTYDSRFLWDAYTMNRSLSDNSEVKYNGVCIAFKKKKIIEKMKSVKEDICDSYYISKIVYDEKKINNFLNKELVNTYQKIKKLKLEINQEQNIIPPLYIPNFKGVLEVKLKKCFVVPMLEFIRTIEAYSPFFKHEFWKEEKEIRTSFCLRKDNVYPGLQTDNNGIKYYDMPITMDCIDHVLLGPEFSDDDINKIVACSDYKLDFSQIVKKKSKGTGIIRSNNG